jgi:hypothetical protein
MEYGFIPKEFFKYILKDYLIPLFKNNGYTKEGNSWIKSNGEILIRISIEKSRSRMSREVSFRFCVGMCPIVIKDVKVEVYGNVEDWAWDERSCNAEIEEFLPKERKKYKFEKHGWLGWYVIFRENACEKLLNEELKVDFENYLLPLLDKIKTEDLFNKVRKFIKLPREDYNIGVYDII